MSVLSFPRLYFRGFAGWDPALTNNTFSEYDPINVGIVLPPGVTYDTYRRWILENDLGNWNVYGSHRCDFVQHDARVTVITGGELEPGKLIAEDPLVGLPLSFDGRLVDLDPRSAFTSQIFFDRFLVGRDRPAIAAPRRHRMESRFHWFSRNRGGLPIAGNAGVVWQTVFGKDSLRLDDPGSKLLAAFAKSLQDDDVLGLMVRFTTYRTTYFQNGIYNDIRQRPRASAELQQMYLAGETFSNPAYSLTVGAIGLWRRGELESIPQGRFLVPPRQNGATAIAERDGKRLSIDLGNALPEIDRNVQKVDFGTLTVRAGDAAIATIPRSRYDRAAYDLRAGIVDLEVKGDLDGPLSIVAENETLLLTESPLAVFTDSRNVYLDEGESKDVDLVVLDRGKPAADGTQVALAVFAEDPNTPPAKLSEAATASVAVTGGRATFRVTASAPGFMNVFFLPYPQGSEPPAPPTPGYDSSPFGFYLNLRTLPFDDAFAANTPIDAIDFDFVYTNILRVYDLTSPVMATPAVGLPLSDPAIWQLPNMAARLKGATSKAMFESGHYMPVTRALSNGRRLLIHRFCDKVLGIQPMPGPLADFARKA